MQLGLRWEDLNNWIKGGLGLAGSRLTSENF